MLKAPSGGVGATATRRRRVRRPGAHGRLGEGSLRGRASYADPV